MSGGSLKVHLLRRDTRESAQDQRITDSTTFVGMAQSGCEPRGQGGTTVSWISPLPLSAGENEEVGRANDSG